MTSCHRINVSAPLGCNYTMAIVNWHSKTKEFWIQAKQMTLWTKSGWAQWACMVFDKFMKIFGKLATYRLSLQGESYKPFLTSQTAKSNWLTTEWLFWLQTSWKDGGYGGEGDIFGNSNLKGSYPVHLTTTIHWQASEHLCRSHYKCTSKFQ